jgi:CheY-like chemotaxis protein
MHALIIEDEVLISLDLQGLFEDIGATSTAIAETEEAAVGAAIAQRPDMITSDVTLKKGTGPAAVRAIRAAIGPVPVVYVTSTPEACTNLAANERVVGKPVSYGALRAALDELRKLLDAS